MMEIEEIRVFQAQMLVIVMFWDLSQENRKMMWLENIGRKRNVERVKDLLDMSVGKIWLKRGLDTKVDL